MKKWVQAKEDLDLKFGKDVYKGIVPKGEIGYIKRYPYIREEEGAIQFPQTVYHFPEHLIEEAKLPSVNEALKMIKSFEVPRENIRGRGWFEFSFNIPANLIPEKMYQRMTNRQVLIKFNKILKEQVMSLVDKQFDDASLQNDFHWIINWKFKDNKVMIQHQSKQYLDDMIVIGKNKTPSPTEDYLFISNKDELIDLSMDLQLISKKIAKAEKEVRQWIQTDEPWEMELLSV